MAKVVTMCPNQGCGSNVWDSQPSMVGTKIPAGNFLLSFAILVAGGSPSKTLRIFEHMGLSCIALSTYFRHQSEILFPVICMHWKKYQKQIVTDIKKENEKGIIGAGDGRHDKELNMTIFISDRHTSIKKHMREQLLKVVHYFDLWHLTKNYVDDIFETFVQSTEDDHECASKALAEITPSPMDTMLEKQPKDEAIAKRDQ
ncbi:Hypothetical predicted protein [Paramuricea clavata]|uniref:Uncharacterized protein n=1 Tax=Paramuricea clavata TaxID=317549 RepID=A0A6S7GNI7_PARCT|nr:Hypothetical predicted protein [Paramuricea clavata]